MTESDARAFLGAGVRDAAVGVTDGSPEASSPLANPPDRASGRHPVWADLGAGDGTFTRALSAILGHAATVYAVDRDAVAMRSLARVASANDHRGDAAEVRTFVADIEDLAPFARALGTRLDGVVIANVLHYVPYARQAATLAGIAAMVRPGGRLIVIEYEHRSANRWVPYPVPFARLVEIVPAGGGTPERRATRGSAFGGVMYLGVVRVGT